MFLSFDLKNTNLTVEVDDEQKLNLDENEELYIGGVHGPSVLAQMEHQYREDKMEEVAAAIKIAWHLRTAPTSETTAELVSYLLAVIANKMLLNSELAMSVNTRDCLQRFSTLRASQKIGEVAS